MSEYSTSKLIMTPTAKKLGKLYSMLPTDGSGDFTVATRSPKYVTNKDGFLELVPAGVPAFDYSSGKPRLVVEDESTNYVKYSTDTSLGNLGATRTTIQSNVAISPTGEMNASKAIPSLETNSHVFAQNIYYMDLNRVVVFSIYINRNYKNSIILRMYDNSANVNGGIKIYNLCVLLSDLSVLYITDNAFYYIEEKKDGWVRLGIGMTKGNDATRINTQVFMSMYDYYTSNPVFTGDGVNGMEYFGAQLEYDKMTSLIPTGASTVTRLKDKIEAATPQGVTEIVNTIDGVEQSPITAIPATYEVPIGNIDKIVMR